MKTIYFIAVLIMISSIVYSEETRDSSSAYSKALERSDFIFVCMVIDEGPLGSGSNAVQKSYLVSYPEFLYFGLVGLDLPGEIWIHYDSSKYSDVPKSGYESSFHKGDTFIAFLDYANRGAFAFQIVRTDKNEQKEAIRETIKMRTEQGHGA